MFSDIVSPTSSSFDLTHAFNDPASPGPKPHFRYPSVVGPSTLTLEPPTPPVPTRSHQPSSNSGSILCPINAAVCNEYYFDDPIPVVLLMVQGRLFKVHRYFLERDSALLRGVLSTLHAQEVQTHPIEIQGVSSIEFKTLLDFFYNGMYQNSPDAVHISDWINLLAASSVLKFDRVREHAIAAIDKTSERPDAVETIILAEKYGITRWLRAAYISLCKRKEPLQRKEAERIGLEKVVKLAQAREEFIKESFGVNETHAASPPASPYPWASNGIQSSRLSPTVATVKAERFVDSIFFTN